jgi:hypothetical protein
MSIRFAFRLTFGLALAASAAAQATTYTCGKAAGPHTVALTGATVFPAALPQV